MTRYRCVVIQSTGQYVSYAGYDLSAALDAMEQNRLADTVVVERLVEGEWDTVAGVWR